MLKEKAQTFNDGLCTIFRNSVGGLTKKVGPLRFDNRAVGVNRFYLAMQNNSQIDRVIRAPRQPNVESNDIAVLHDGTQFTIKQIQMPPEIVPPVMDLSLEKMLVPKPFADED